MTTAIWQYIAPQQGKKDLKSDPGLQIFGKEGRQQVRPHLHKTEVFSGKGSAGKEPDEKGGERNVVQTRSKKLHGDKKVGQVLFHANPNHLAALLEVDCCT